jgi:hypothetical protein
VVRARGPGPDPDDRRHLPELRRWPVVGRLFDQLSRFILLEDRAILESSRPHEVPPPAEERSVPTDRATLHFRSWYLARVRPSRPRLHGLA